MLLTPYDVISNLFTMSKNFPLVKPEIKRTSIIKLRFISNLNYFQSQ